MPATSARPNAQLARSRLKRIVASRYAAKVPISDLRNRIDSVTFVLKQTIEDEGTNIHNFGLDKLSGDWLWPDWRRRETDRGQVRQSRQGPRHSWRGA